MRQGVLDHLTESGVTFEIATNLKAILPRADVVYWTRVQKERLKNPDQFVTLRDAFHIGMEEMSLLKPEAFLMHPMPIVGEISPDVDSHPQAAYFEQADNGIYVRAALLLHIFGVSVPD